MKRLCFLAVASTLAISAAAWADDPPAISTPFALGNDLTLGAMSSAPFSNGLGQLLSAWTQEGIFASELADQIPWLQTMDADEIDQRTRWIDYRINYPVHVARRDVGDNQQQDRNRQDRVRNRNHEDNGEHRARHDHDWRSIDRGLSDQRHDHNGTKNSGPGKLGDHHAAHDSHAPNNGGPQSHSPISKGNSPSQGLPPAHVPPPPHAPPPAHVPPPAPSRGGRGRK